MSDLQDLQARYDALEYDYWLLRVGTGELEAERDGAIEGRNEYRALLREFVTPPLSYGKKQDALARARVLLEGWAEVTTEGSKNED